MNILKLLFSSILVLNLSNAVFASADPTPLPLSERLSFLREHRTEGDIAGAIKYFEPWHNQDVAVIRTRLHDPENLAALDRYSDAMNVAFTQGHANFSRLSLAYYLYSLVLSKEIEPGYYLMQKPGFQSLVDSIHGFIRDPAGAVSKYAEMKEINDIMKVFLNSFDGVGIGCVPFVSETACATYRNLNESYGIGMPLLGLPLGRSSYDGNAGRLPEEFYTHDIRHMVDERIGYDQLHKSYHLYSVFNNLVRDIADGGKQLKCDIFLFRTGHEILFTLTYWRTPEEIAEAPTKDGDEKSITSVISPEKYNALFEREMSFLTTNMSYLPRKEKVDASWQWTVAEKLYREYRLLNGMGEHEEINEHLKTRIKNEYYRNRSWLRFLHNVTTDYLYTPGEIAEEMSFGQDRQLTHTDLITFTAGQITAEMYPNSPDYDLEAPESSEFYGWFTQLISFNEMVELRMFCRELGIEFEPTAEGVTHFYSDVVETFKTLVVPQFKAMVQAGAV